VAIYAIGDVQGCYDELSRLLDQLRLDTSRDEVWFVGDLVNRGPKSLATLRLVRSLGSTALVTLGNHDLHLLAQAAGNGQRGASADLHAVLKASDGKELTDWLRQQPLAHYRPELNTLMVHAGVPPAWDPLTTVKLARETEALLRGPKSRGFLQVLYGDQPDQWSPELRDFERARYVINALTRIRFCRRDGSLEFEQKGGPGAAPASLTPWFRMPDRRSSTVRVVFGHWSALGLLQQDRLLCIDTGCVWGGQLTAVRLDGPCRLWQVKSPGYRSAGD
jgi:bis(5'-nucleosyl)-tetraphosphatase (symmetrical)